MAGLFGIGDTVVINLTWETDIVVDTSSGAPTLLMETGVIDRVATYVGAIGTQIIRFIYTVQAGDTSADLDWASTSAFQLNGAAVRATDGRPLSFELPPPGAAGSFSFDQDNVVDGIAPSATLIGTRINSAGSATVRSSEVGTAYLVRTSLAVTSLDDITSAPDANWNAVVITAANTNTALAAAGLGDGTYRLYTTDAAGNLSAPSTAVVTVDNTAPVATLTASSVQSSGSVTVRSSEPGTAYLVSTNVTVTSASSITNAPDASWNSVAIAAANTNTSLVATGLGEGTYRLYTRDAAGNLSAASTALVTVDNTPPVATLTAATLQNTGSATVQSSEPGTAYLVKSSVVVSSLASITSAPDANWNSVAIAAANTSTALPATGLSEGTYRLYTADAAGNLSAASSATITISGLVDTTPPRGALVGPAIFDSPLQNQFGMAVSAQWIHPSFVDIDGDGDLDAILGTTITGTAEGQTVVFLNTGSASNPAFTKLDAANPFGLANVNVPHWAFGDIDGDGDLDGLVGEQDGHTWVQLNVGSRTNPQFGTLETSGYGFTDLSYHASPELADIDGDGDLDAVVGERDGHTMVYLNKGSRTNPDFNAPQDNPFGLLVDQQFPNPTLADIDGDGDLDLFIADFNGVRLYKNIGTASSPQFGTVEPAPYGLGSGVTAPSLSLVDIDADGDLDAFIGTLQDTILFYRNSGAVVAPVTSGSANGQYGIGSSITLRVSFSENVLVNTSGGTPTLLLETGATDRAAVYTGGSGTPTLTFTYVVQAGDTAADLDIASAAALTLNGGTMRDAAGNNAILTLATPGAAGSLAANAALVIDGIAPVATLTANSIRSSSPATVRSSEPGTAYLVNTNVTVTSTASITSAPDASWNSVAITAANTNTSLSAAGLGEGTYRLYVRDAAGNLSAPSTAVVTVDNTAPVATLTAASVKSSGAVTVQSSETGTAYLVNTNVAVTTAASITSAPDASWNSVAIAAASTNTTLAATGLGEGTYRLYTRDAAGNLSAASTALVTVDNMPPVATLTPATLQNTASATVQSSELGTAYLVNDSVGVSSLASITSAPDDSWNSVAITAPNTSTALPAAGLVEGTYRLYTVDAAGNLSVASTGAVMIDDRNDLVIGTDGNDTLDGLDGADTMIGGDGSDLYVVDDPGDLVVETEAEPLFGGIDVVHARVASYTLPANVEWGVILSEGAANLTGNGLANRLEAGRGDNVLQGGSGNDQVSYASATSGVTVTLTSNAAQATGGSGSDTLLSIERLLGSSSSDRLTGNSAANVLQGGAGQDTLEGGAGADTLSGGAGADHFVFQSGSGLDVISDFSHLQGDRLLLASDLNGSGITSAAAAVARLTQVQGNAILDLGGGYTVRLTGVRADSLGVDDFTIF